ncbi:ParB family protein [Enterobacter mori]|uniref:ParB family protein n=1 Tax=Enterobacter mori TaxID=539813 RepID=UPI003B83B51A
MKTPRPIIGRTLGENSLVSSRSEGSQRFTLASGNKAIFQVEVIGNDQIGERTYVDQSINGRDQSALTPESLEDITRTLPFQQFHPAIGRLVGERIEILDGSRRRASALLCGSDLKVMYTRSEISAEDARQLAADLQTAKEHNLREIGIRLQALKDSGLTQKDIAKLERMSESKVTRAIQAASVPQELLAVFPIQSELNYPDYKFLQNAVEVAAKRKISLEHLISQVALDAAALREQNLAPEDLKNELVNSYRQNVISMVPKPAAQRVVTENLREYEDSRIYAKKKTDTKSRKIVYEFSRMNKEIQDKLDEAIRKILAES